MKKMINSDDYTDLDKRHIRIIKYNPNTGLGIVRCDHRTINYLLSFLNDSIFDNCNIKSILTSGSIRGLEHKINDDLNRYI